MTTENQSGPYVNRRDFLRLSGLATAGVLASACGTTPGATSPESATDGEGATSAVSAAVDGLSEVPREKTLIIMWGGSDGQFTDMGLANPYLSSIVGWRAVYGAMEPLFYYSVFTGEEIPWLATGYEYSEDFRELTVNIREGVEWSDGESFDAHDIAFTINMLKEYAPSLRSSAEIRDWVESVEAIDDLTARITFYEPRPRFAFSHLNWKFGRGIFWVPEHIYKDVDDVTSFNFYDVEKGWPVHTGPFQVVDWRASQQIIDRRDDWWGAKTGFAELPDVERIIKLPWTGEERAAQLVIQNEVDSCLDLRATTISQVVNGNPAVITHTYDKLPYAYIDWWATSMWFNCDEPPYNDPNVRWAISYTLNREQMVDVALEGSGIVTPLPFPDYPPLRPYLDAAAPLLEKYPTNEHNLDKAAERMAASGYEKDSEGFWAKDGERVANPLNGSAVFNDIGPVLAEQLQRGGFQVNYATPADVGQRQSDGSAKLFLNGHGGSIRDPFVTLDQYTSKYYVPTGEPAVFLSRWQNSEYDAILEEMAGIQPSPDDPRYMDLFLAAMEIWLENLVDCPIQQWLHRIPMNTTYWNNWPTEDDPYVNGAWWATTGGLIFHNLKAAQG